MGYVDLLKDPRWQRKRLEILQRDDWRCQECTDNGSTLHVHHKKYERGRKPWEYEDVDLVTLCESCHEAVTWARRELDGILGKLCLSDVQVVVGFVKGLRLSASGDDLAGESFGEFIGLRAATAVYKHPKLDAAVALAEDRFDLKKMEPAT